MALELIGNLMMDLVLLLSAQNPSDHEKFVVAAVLLRCSVLSYHLLSWCFAFDQHSRNSHQRLGEQMCFLQLRLDCLPDVTFGSRCWSLCWNHYIFLVPAIEQSMGPRCGFGRARHVCGDAGRARLGSFAA